MKREAIGKSGGDATATAATGDVEAGPDAEVFNTLHGMDMRDEPKVIEPGADVDLRRERRSSPSSAATVP